MQDRQPMFPGRVRMLPVAGQENVFDMVMADEPTELGTPPIKKNLLTDLTASLYGLPNPTVNDLLGVLSGAAMIEATPKLTPITMSLSEFAEGSAIKLRENGVLTEFYVAKHNYESDLNGNGRTLLVRKNVYDIRQWHTSNVNAYATSAIDTFLNSAYKGLLDANIQLAMATTSFYYTPGNNNWTVANLIRSVFLLSITELGLSASSLNEEGETLPTASSLLIAHLDGAAATQWTRSPYTSSVSSVARLSNTGGTVNGACITEHGCRPVFTLPQTLTFDLYQGDDGKKYWGLDDPTYTYAAADILGNIIGGFPRIETGEYTGTGTFGAGNPTRIEVGFRPKLALIGRDVVGILPYSGYWSVGVLWIEGIEATITAGVSSQARFTQGDTYLSIYSLENANAQLNTSGSKFVYAIVG